MLQERHQQSRRRYCQNYGPMDKGEACLICGNGPNSKTAPKLRRVTFLILSTVLVLQLFVLTVGAVSTPISNMAMKPAALSTKDLDTIFKADSYWVLSLQTYDANASEAERYYVEFSTDCYHFSKVNKAGDDLEFAQFGWSYDGNGVLRAAILEDGWNSGIFTLKDGMLVSEGMHYKAILLHSADAKKNYDDAASSFQKNYGSINPAKRLVTSENGFRYRDISEWDTLPYDSFRYVAMYHSLGVVMPEINDNIKRIQDELAPIFGSNKASAIHVHNVLSDIDLPETDEGVIHYGKSVNVINLVFPNGLPYDAFMDLIQSGTKLLKSGAAKGTNMTSNSLYDALVFWNDTDAVTIQRIGLSIVIIRGPVQEVQTVSSLLGVDPTLWS